MSTSSKSSKREQAALAAERRLRITTRASGGVASDTTTSNTTRTSATAPSTSNHRAGSRAGPRATAAERVSASGGGGGGGGSNSKRRAASPEAPDAAAGQIGFSDSDSSNAEEVTCVGVSAPVATARGEGIKSNNSKSNDSTISSCSSDHGRKRSGSGHIKDQRREKRGRMDKERGAMASSVARGAGAERSQEAGAESGTPRQVKTCRLVSWNIDCLNGANKMARVEEVCAILLESEEIRLPDVVLLQEVDADMLQILNARLGVGGRYRAYPSRIPVESRYFTQAFVRIGTVTVQDSDRKDFPESRMGRDLTSIRCTFNGKPLLIMTSHFESEKQNSDERKAQFNQVLRKLLSFREGPAIFAGDTNLREPEVKQEKLAKEASDMWQLCGGDPELRFTWDLLKNDNCDFGGGFRPRARYDRMFVNPQAKAAAKSFALLGTERMAPPHSCFPSDHFGIDTCFEW